MIAVAPAMKGIRSPARQGERASPTSSALQAPPASWRGMYRWSIRASPKRVIQSAEFGHFGVKPEAELASASYAAKLTAKWIDAGS